MRILTLIPIVFGENLYGEIKCAQCTGLIKNGNVLSGESCFAGSDDSWILGQPSDDITLSCQTVTNRQTNLELGFEQYIVTRNWSENGLVTDSTLKQSEYSDTSK